MRSRRPAVTAAAGGGEEPDVFWMNGPNFQLHAANGMPEPLSSLEPDTSKYPESLVDLYTYQDEPYGLPKDMDTVGLCDFQQAAKKLTDPAEDVYGAGVGASLTGYGDAETIAGLKSSWPVR